MYPHQHDLGKAGTPSSDSANHGSGGHGDANEPSDPSSRPQNDIPSDLTQGHALQLSLNFQEVPVTYPSPTLRSGTYQPSAPQAYTTYHTTAQQMIPGNGYLGTCNELPSMRNCDRIHATGTENLTYHPSSYHGGQPANQLRWCYACSCFHDNPGCPEAYDHPYHVQGAAGIEGYVQSQYSAPAPALSPGFMGGASTSSFVLSSVAASVPSSSCVQSHEGVGYTPQGRPMADAGRNTRPLAPAPPTESAAEGLGGPTVGLYTKIPPKGRGGKREKQRKG